MRAADHAKPKVRAITGFITIDAKSYPAQIQETVTFLSQVRDAVKAAGYDVAGIRISTQPFPEYTRGLSRADALAVLRGIDDLAATLRFGPNIGPAMLKDTDDTAPVDLLTDILSQPGNRLNANIVVAGEDGIHWNAVRQAARIIKAVGERSPHGQGNFNFAAIAMLKPYGPFYPGAWHPGGGPRSFAIGLEAASVVMDVFEREHDPRTAGKALTEALTVHARAVEGAAMKAAAGSGWTYAGIDPTPAPGGQVSIGAAIESFTGAPFGSPGTETAAGIITRAVKDVPVKQTGYSGLMIPVLEETVLTRRWTEGTYGLDSILAYSAVCAGGVDTVPLAGRHERSRHRADRRRRRDAGVQVEQAARRATAAGAGKEGGRDDRVQRRAVQRDHPAAPGFAAEIATHIKAPIQKSCSGKRSARDIAGRPATVRCILAARMFAGNIAISSAISAQADARASPGTSRPAAPSSSRIPVRVTSRSGRGRLGGTIRTISMRPRGTKWAAPVTTNISASATRSDPVHDPVAYSNPTAPASRNATHPTSITISGTIDQLPRSRSG